MARSSGSEGFAPGGWADVVTRTLMAMIAAFVALCTKEWTETRQLDLPASIADALWVAGGALAVNALLMVIVPRRED